MQYFVLSTTSGHNMHLVFWGGRNLQILRNMGIDCDEMVFGKPSAGVHSDWRDGDARAEDMEKEVCFQTFLFLIQTAFRAQAND